MKRDDHPYVTNAYRFWMDTIGRLDLCPEDQTWFENRFYTVLVSATSTNLDYQEKTQVALEPGVKDTVEVISRLMKRWLETNEQLKALPGTSPPTSAG
jgi:hypothetical protein